eukprot:Skav210107  [mRNA]  locus=scaffold2194:39612:41576:+ [translate_table: standard]
MVCDFFSSYASIFVFSFANFSLWIQNCICRLVILDHVEARDELKKGWYTYLSTGESSILDFDKGFKALDRLKEPLQKSLTGFEIPQIVVVGATSTGKSTLLRRFSHLPFFPTSNSMCTRMPIKIEMRKISEHDAVSGVVMSVHSFDGTTYSDLAEERSELSLEDATSEVKRKMGDLLERAGLEREGLGIIADSELRIRVVSDNFPVLNLVDLPGMVQADGAEDRRSADAIATQRLFDRYMGAKGARHSLLLCVVPATSQPVDWHAVHFLKRHKLEGQALAVITKCDHLRRKKDQQQLQKWLSHAPQESSWTDLGYGYTAVAAEEDIEEAKAATIDDMELNFFSNAVPEKECPSEHKATSIASVRTKVMNAYFHQVFEQWVPSAASELLSFWTATASDFRKFGLQPSPAEPRDVTQAIKEAVSKEVTARWKRVEKRLTETIRSSFPQELERLPDDQKMSLEAYSSAGMKKLEEIMDPLAAEAKNALDVDEENSSVKLLRFPRSKHKLIEVFRHELREQLIKEPWKVAYLSLTSTSAAAASERFIQNVVQDFLVEEEINAEASRYYEELSMHLQRCDESLEKLQEFYQEHCGSDLAAHPIVRAFSTQCIPDAPSGPCKSLIERLKAGKRGQVSNPFVARGQQFCLWKVWKSLFWPN